jgi:hypothetical protein
VLLDDYGSDYYCDCWEKNKELLVDEVEYTLNGQMYRLLRQQVIRSVAGEQPGKVRDWVVEIEGRHFPVKQAFALATGHDRADFNTYQARTPLMRLGFQVVRARELAAGR